MVFSSFSFLFAFLPLLLLVYFAPLRSLGQRRVRNGVLLGFSLAFYAFGGLRLIPVLLISIVLNYCCGLLADEGRGEKLRRGAVIFAVIGNLTLLFFFKYLGFVTENLNALFPEVPVKELVLPIGISFYTFQSLSYTIDVYRGQARAERNPFLLALYIALFPQLVAGPIVRYTTIDRELHQRQETLDDFAQGASRFLFGLAKKILLANAFAQIADPLFSMDSGQLALSAAWLAVAAYSLQIYFDFSGYSDMAIGLGRMFGFHFLENFNYPYISASVQEFWRRWHISLSSWFRDYLYIPLGGNRGGKARHIRNLLIVWGLTGFWHGAAWTYLLWGLYYAVLLIGERYLWGGLLNRLPRPVRHVYALFFILIGWLVFRASDIGQVGSFLQIMFGGGAGGLWDNQTTYYLLEFRWELLLGLLACLPWKQGIQKLAEQGTRPRLSSFLLDWGKPALALFLGALSLLSLTSTGYNPFIYFQF